MRIKKARINNSPYLGVNSYCNDEVCLVPNNIFPKEEKIFKEYLDAKVVKININQSPLLGVYAIGIKYKLVIGAESISNYELKILEKEGFKLKFVTDYNALGNLIALNSNYGIASPLLSDTTIKEISKFLKVPIEKKQCVELDLPGSSVYVNDSLFLVNPSISEKEYKYLQKKFKVPGIATTLNYGGSFVGNDVVGNSKGLLVGANTSNIELQKVDSLVVEL
ncbi:MAG: translation initiation factor IF-6 [archaeon]|nr:translation initiation factor IF-6 [archaeon]MDD2477962.1 translation initiation factor IF-6 [Candidatus ainarchaeum sp.]MDD3084956.1 translation initiation factor IF-6 [Candidatus ainarchaeum sp.]MDD4221408.1 translation initiation factor IF-6 [Candidatus ainarchaeum sp.]MDD4662952.1 translation initiation factor IF-6 [Candidatus ainarchaeum sp.]